MLKQQQTPARRLQQRLLAILGGLIVLVIIAALLTTQSTNDDDDENNSNGWQSLCRKPVCNACGPNFEEYELDWATLQWANGNKDGSFSDIGGSNTNLSINYQGATSKLAYLGTGTTPNIQTFFSGGAMQALSNYVCPGMLSDEAIEMSFAFDPPIPAQLAFDLYHVNGNWYSGDKVKVYALSVLEGAEIYPSFTAAADPSWQEEGNGTIDAFKSGSTYKNVSAGVNFNSSALIDTLMIEWSNCDICGTGVHGIGIGNISFFSNANSLPVEWGELNIKWQGEASVLSWQTQQEVNNDRFEIERSVDGKIFEKIGIQPGQGNTTQRSDYQFTDINARFSGQKNLYYRIKQVDFDGQSSYSNLLELSTNDNLQLELLIYPNPASEQVSFKLAGASEQNLRYQVISTQGKQMKAGQIDHLSEWQLDVSDWPNGTYHLRIDNNTQQITKTFVVQH